MYPALVPALASQIYVVSPPLLSPSHILIEALQTLVEDHGQMGSWSDEFIVGKLNNVRARGHPGKSAPSAQTRYRHPHGIGCKPPSQVGSAPTSSGCRRRDRTTIGRSPISTFSAPIKPPTG